MNGCFSFTEMVDKVGGLLRTIGLTKDFAPLVFIVAHGSSSVNNPYFAAYDCGACAGKPGAPNARAFAWMANHETVRSLLRERGIEVPVTTRFVAALHNTSTDDITYFDSESLDQHPPTGLQSFKQTMKKALQRNARE
ncbi:MAG: putative inorganic carbon transporter subunit DabA, partial [Gammaproteobacteria bacterium]